MSERRDTIVRAAFAVFSRYGVRRATMGDIAEEAGVARQTLYNLFADKDDLMRATVRLYADNALTAIEAECTTLPDLGDKLDVVFDRLVLVPYDRIRETPHGDEILTGFRDAAWEEVTQAELRFGALLEHMIAPSAEQLSAAGLTPKHLSDLMQSSWYGFRHKARDREHLLELLASHKAIVLNAMKSR